MYLEALYFYNYSNTLGQKFLGIIFAHFNSSNWNFQITTKYGMLQYDKFSTVYQIFYTNIGPLRFSVH